MQHSQRPLGRPRKEGHEQSTKETILELATDLFLEKGYPLVSMDDIAHNCNVTKATVYYYYKTKSALFTDAMVQLMLRITQSIIKILSTEESLKEQLFTLAKVHLQATFNMDTNAFMKEAKHSLSFEQQNIMQDAEDKMHTALKNGIQRAMDRGELPESDAHLSALAFISMLTIGKVNDHSYSNLDNLAAQIVGLFWNGVANHE